MKQLTTRLENYGLVTIQYELGRTKIEIPFFTDMHGNKHDVTNDLYQFFYDEIIDWESDNEDYMN
jgi:hypothetical protein